MTPDPAELAKLIERAIEERLAPARKRGWDVYRIDLSPACAGCGNGKDDSYLFTVLFLDQPENERVLYSYALLCPDCKDSKEAIGRAADRMRALHERLN